MTDKLVPYRCFAHVYRPNAYAHWLILRITYSYKLHAIYSRQHMLTTK